MREQAHEVEDSGEQREAERVYDATPLEPGPGSSGTLCAWNEDWYRFQAAEGDDVVLVLGYQEQFGVLHLQLTDAAGEPAAGCTERDNPLAECASTSGRGVERIERIDMPEGDWFVRIWGVDDGFVADQGAYNIALDIDSEPEPGE